MMQRFRSDLVVQVSETEAHRMIKIWRALWKKMAWFGFPRVGPRSRPCLHQLRPEAAERRLVRGRGGAPDQRSLAFGVQGLAAVLAVAWESQLCLCTCVSYASATCDAIRSARGSRWPAPRLAGGLGDAQPAYDAPRSGLHGELCR